MSDEALARAKVLADEIYLSHGAGCCWHIVLDDCNLETGSVEFCIQWAKDNGCSGACTEIGPLMLSLSETDRNEVRKVIYPWSKWPDEDVS